MHSTAINFCTELIRHNSTNDMGNEASCARLIAERLSSRKEFEVSTFEFAPGRTSLVARAGPQDHPLVFTGHIDTVPIGSVSDWSHDPFGGHIQDGKLYGRGSSDMKSGVAAFIEACMSRVGNLQHQGVALVITAAEETGCEGAKFLFESGCLGNAGALVVAEPTSNELFIGHKGALWVKATTKGVAAHGSMPDLGVNAVDIAADAVVRLRHFCNGAEHSGLLGKPTLNVGLFNGGSNVNTVPDRAEFYIDLRTVSPCSHATTVQKLRPLLEEVDELDIVLDVPPLLNDPADAWVAQAGAIVETVTGRKFRARAASYFTDAGVLSKAYVDVPSIILGPGEPQMAHKADEYCLTEKLDQAVLIYQSLLDNWASR